MHLGAPLDRTHALLSMECAHLEGPCSSVRSSRLHAPLGVFLGCVHPGGALAKDAHELLGMERTRLEDVRSRCVLCGAQAGAPQRVF